MRRDAMVANRPRGIGELEMNRTVMNGFAQRQRARRWFGQGQTLALALASVSVVAIGRAEACTVGGVPSTFASGATVDCAGTTTNTGPGGATGYGGGGDNNNIYNIQVGATVTGTNFGFFA